MLSAVFYRNSELCSTIKANLSVGLPLDMQVYEAGKLQLGVSQRIAGDDPYYQTISANWGEALTQALKSLPDFYFSGGPETSR